MDTGVDVGVVASVVLLGREERASTLLETVGDVCVEDDDALSMAVVAGPGVEDDDVLSMAVVAGPGVEDDDVLSMAVVAGLGLVEVLTR